MGTAAKAARSKPGRPEWALRLERLREQLGFSQAALAKRLEVSPMAPSRWERGINEPPAEIYIQLGKLAGHQGCWYFWEQAGLRKSDLAAFFDPQKDGHAPVEITYAAAAKNASSSAQLALPVFRTDPAVGTHGSPKLLRESVSELVVAPRSWCPHPGRTFCIKMGGDRMNPVIRSGDLVAVDESENDPLRLEGKMVLARSAAEGFTVASLQRFGSAQVLTPENQDYPAQYLAKNGWMIVGRVLWWMAKAP